MKRLADNCDTVIATEGRINQASNAASSCMGSLDPARRSFPLLFRGKIAEVIDAGYSAAASFRLDHLRAVAPTPRLVSPLLIGAAKRLVL
jgi:hypothetical protein